MNRQRAIYREPTAVLSLVVRLLDVLVVIGCATLAFVVRFSVDRLPLPHDYIVLVALAGLLVLILFPAFGVYNSWRGQKLPPMAARVIFAWASVLLALMALLYLLKVGENYSRLWFGIWSVFVAIAMVIVRALTYRLLRGLRGRGWNRKRVVIVGAGALGQELARRISETPWIGYDLVSFFDDDQALQGTFSHGAPIRTDMDALTRFVDQHNVQEVWLSLPLRAELRIREIQHALRHSPVNIRFVPDIYGFLLINHSVSDVVGIPMLNLTASPMTGINLLVKTAEDYILASLILILISPLLLAIVLAVKLSSPGPVLFRQRRHGWDGRVITVYKFRSMVLHEDPEVQQARKTDPRVTPVGKLLRRTSMDELPQFINVIQGRMSIVGPRPHAVEHNDYYKGLLDEYMLRHRVKPGITGWAQINGFRGETDTLEKMKKRLEYDLFYIENWSLTFDLRIITRTLFGGFLHENAR